ncbi:MAG TPA: hypothetical protein VH415_00300 [Nitrososphaeraceae archaeon]
MTKHKSKQKLEPSSRHVVSEVLVAATGKPAREIIENEIECPRCYSVMILCSDFDSLYYVCEDCDFSLHAIKK